MTTLFPSTKTQTTVITPRPPKPTKERNKFSKPAGSRTNLSSIQSSFKMRRSRQETPPTPKSSISEERTNPMSPSSNIIWSDMESTGRWDQVTRYNPEQEGSVSVFLHTAPLHHTRRPLHPISSLLTTVRDTAMKNKMQVFDQKIPMGTMRLGVSRRCSSPQMQPHQQKHYHLLLPAQPRHHSSFHHRHGL